MNYKGIKFDDIVVDIGGVWSGVCQECIAKYNIATELLEEYGEGICGVEGCSNEVVSYIDFPVGEMKVYTWIHDKDMCIDAVIVAQEKDGKGILTWHEGNKLVDTMEELPYAELVFVNWAELAEYVDLKMNVSMHSWQVFDVE